MTDATDPTNLHSSTHLNQLKTVLIGSAETVVPLAKQLALLADPPRVIGCVLVGEVPGHLRGGPVLGSLSELPLLHGVHGFQLGIISLPASMDADSRRARAILNELGIAERSVPPLAELLRAPSSAPRHGTVTIDMAELIGRAPYGIDRKAVGRTLEGKRVLITGAGGSIGSELARLAATFRPACVQLMERSENSLFEIDRQIARRFPDVQRRAIFHDIVDPDRTLRVLVEHKPDVVFHAAAHKHVPLMEDHPAHAVDNNFFGTKSIADAALAVGAERFVMISSDKAVNPTSVMGATKRLAEMYVQALHRQVRRGGAVGATRFCMVRFGNVLGSACSVLPIWTGQISEGGPVTVTDERMTRYFMTIHEAATLVMQSAAMCPESPFAGVYVLDMGEPLRILDLARRLVSLHGYEPHIQPGTHETSGSDQPGLEIRLTGIRPGEKLHEELAYAAEQVRPTDHPGINAWIGENEDLPTPAAMVADLSSVRANSDRRAVLETIARHIPGFAESSGLNKLRQEFSTATAAA